MAITKGQIIEAIHEGTAVANRRYEDWSNGWWVTDAGVEGLMAASIAEAIHQRQTQQDSLMMEMAFGDIEALSEAQPRRGPRPAALRRTNRADIVLLNGRDRPTCIIEVKRSWNRDVCLKDLDRIHGLTQRLSHRNQGSLRRGFLAMTVAKGATSAKSPRDRIGEQVDRIRDAVHRQFRNGSANLVFHQGEPVPLGERFRDAYGEWVAASLCVEIYIGK
ncbi:MAG: hypothetical protein OXH14_08840 [Alphaproteobacteria bacterium]|nr:hypothetical protein [Alphaproteobacteria bacterium]